MTSITPQEAYSQSFEPALIQVKDLFGFLIDQPIILLALGFMVSAVVIKEALYRNGNGIFTRSSAGVIALIISFFAASIVASNLRSLGNTIGYIVVIGLPIAVLAGLVLLRGRNRGNQDE